MGLDSPLRARSALGSDSHWTVIHFLALRVPLYAQKKLPFGSLVLKVGLDSRLRARSALGSDSPLDCHSLPRASSPSFRTKKAPFRELGAESGTRPHADRSRGF